jgi:hypothetical protein
MRIEAPSARTGRVRGAQIAFFGGAVAEFVASFFAKGGAYVLTVPVLALIAAIGGVYLARATRSWIPAVWGAYLLVIAVGSVAHGATRPRPPRGVLWALAGAQIALLVVALFLIVRFTQRSKELERMISFEATVLAFFTTLAAAFTYAIFERWLGAPRLSMGWVWLFGLTAWIFYSFLVGRRYA